MKPKPSTVLYFLCLILTGGFVALFLSANHAFAQVATSQAQAVFSALLIEAGMIVDAISLFRPGSLKNKIPAAFGMTISLAVSGLYNYTSAQIIGREHGLIDPILLSALAVGPLSALAFLALGVGAEFSSYEKRQHQWETDQRYQAEKAAQEHIEQGLKQAQIEADAMTETERIKAQAAFDLRKLEIENAEHQAANERRREMRKEKKSQLTPKLESSVSETALKPFTPMQGLSMTEKVLQYYTIYPESSKSAAARAIGTSHTTVATELKRLELAGKIHSNGKVVILEKQ